MLGHWGSWGKTASGRKAVERGKYLLYVTLAIIDLDNDIAIP